MTTADVVERPTSSAAYALVEKTFMASNSRDNDAEYEALDDAGHDVGEHQSVARGDEVADG